MLRHAVGILMLTTIIGLLDADRKSAEAQDAEVASDSPAEVNDAAHLLTLVDRNQLLLSSIPTADAEDQSVKTRAVMTDQRFGGQMRPLGVYGGHLLAIMERQLVLVAIDLHSGDIRRLATRAARNAVYAKDHLYFISVVAATPDDQRTNALMHTDLRTMKTRQVRRLASHSAQMQPIWLVDFSMAISPDGTRVAVTEMHNIPGQIDATPSKIIITGSDGALVHPDREFTARLHSTGGGYRMLAPKLTWTRDDSIVVAGVKNGRAAAFTNDGPIMDVTRIDAKTGKTARVCSLPGFYPRMHEPWFAQDASGETLIDLGLRGQYQIDFENKKLVEARFVGRDYALMGSDKKYALKYKEETLEERTLPHRVFPSADGSRIAWLPADVGPLPAPTVIGVLNTPMPLKTHDPVRGTRTILERRFVRQGETSQNTTTNVCIWITDADLKRSTVFDKLKKEANEPIARPPVVRAPPIKSTLKIAMTTNKAVYKRHEPLTLTIKIENLTKTPVKFETKRLMNGAMPFGVDIKSARTRAAGRAVRRLPVQAQERGP